MGIARTFFRHAGPLSPGSEAPALSLTADDGTWVRSSDDLGRRHLVLAFFRDAAASAGLLRGLEAARGEIEAQEARIVGVNHARPDALRRVRERLGLGYPLVHDLLAAVSRRYHQSGRRPYVRDGVVVVGRDGRVAWHRQGGTDASEVLATLRRLSGAEAPEAPIANGGTIDWERAEALLGGPEGYLLLDVRTPDEFGAHHVPGAVNVPVDELPGRHAELGRSGRVLTVCQTGGRSRTAASFLVSVGWTEVYDVGSGMAAWRGGGG